MTYHRLTTLAILTALCLSATAMAEEERPRRMMDLLEPGMKVGVQFVRNSSQVTLWVFSDEEYAIAKDAQEMGLDELREKYEQVEQRYQVALKSFLEIMDGERVEEPFKFLAGRPFYIAKSGFAGMCGTVEAVGEDYVLITPHDDNFGPRVFASHSISQLRLNAQARSFSVRDGRHFHQY